MNKRTGCLIAGCLTVMMATAAVCSGCGEKQAGGSAAGSGEIPYIQQDVLAMDTYMSLTAYGDNAETAVAEAVEEITRLDETLSTSVSDSEIALANDGSIVLLSEDTVELIQKAAEINASTDGAFDITMYPLMCEWGFPNEDYKVPSDKTLQKLLQYTGQDKIHLDADKSILSLSENTQIDLGGIAKGYLGDRLKEIMEENEVSSAMVSLGSSTIQLVGAKPDGSRWKIAVQDPKDRSAYLGVLEVEDCVVDTSGGYERYFEKDGETYWHILDPETGKPARSGLSSVTIIGQDGASGDALSTALFVMGKDKATEYWREHRDEFDAVLVEEDGTISVTAGLSDCFQSDYPFDVIE